MPRFVRELVAEKERAINACLKGTNSFFYVINLIELRAIMPKFPLNLHVINSQINPLCLLVLSGISRY